MDEYEFVRSRIMIHYHPGTKQPTDYIREYHRRYTPDFLIRHKQTGKAFLIEIKPRAFESDPQLVLRKQVAENYIKWKGYDWEYKVIFDDEIILSEDHLKEFIRCCKNKSRSALWLWFEEYNKRFDRSAPAFFSTAPRNCDIEFVMFGTRTKGNRFRKNDTGVL